MADPDRRCPRRSPITLATTLLVACLAVVALALLEAPGGIAPTAAAQEPPAGGDTTSTSDPASAIVRGTAPLGQPPAGDPTVDNDGCFGDIIPRPGCGSEPESPNARGGWQQTAVFVGILGGMGLIGFLAWRSSVTSRRRTRPTPEPGSSDG